MQKNTIATAAVYFATSPAIPQLGFFPALDTIADGSPAFGMLIINATVHVIEAADSPVKQDPKCTYPLVRLVASAALLAPLRLNASQADEKNSWTRPISEPVPGA